MGDIVRAPGSEKLIDFLWRYKGQIQDILAKQFDEKRFAKLIIAQINRVPGLLACTPISVVNSVLHAASMGLEIRQNSAYLLPFKDKWSGKKQCQLVIDYRGKIDLAVRSGNVTDLEARLVYAEDSLEIEFGLDPKFRHIPNYDAAVRGQVRLGYAVAWLKDKARPHIEPMSVAEINRIRDKSIAKDNGPWVTDYDQMARKTLVHRIFNYLPQSPEMAQSQEVDDAEALDLPLPPLIIPDRPEDDEKPILESGHEAQNQALEQSLMKAGIPTERALELTQERRDEQRAKEEAKQARAVQRQAKRIPVLKEFPPIEQVTNGQQMYVGGKLYEFSDEKSAYALVVNSQ